MTLTTPIVIDGNDYPYLTTNLAITSRYSPEGTMDASIALRFAPTRIEDGLVISSNENAITMYRGSLRELKDENEVEVMVAIKNALESLIANKLV